MRKHRNLKYWIGRVHLWLGLGSGLLVLFLGITGCILAFQREIENATQQYRYIDNENKPLLKPSDLKVIAEKALPGKKAHSATYYKNGRAAEVAFFSLEPAYYYTVYINPYSGQVQKVKDMDADFFRVILMGHFYLWLPPTIGQPIVATGTLVFLVMLITGLVLWWPRNKAARKQRFSIKWNARWKRVNYDLHNVLGFYITWVIIFIMLTGLVWGFQWFAKSMYWITSGGKDLVAYYEPFSDKAGKALPATAPVEDRVWQKMQAEYPNTQMIEVHYPENDTASVAGVSNPDIDTYWKMDIRYFDQYTLKEIPVNHAYGRFAEASTADRIARLNYDIHVGAILGLPGKIMAFCASLVAASLPVTGFYIWWGRRHKKKKGQVVEKKEAVLV
ncbi:PepSY-associated TM helix domain-containing protein [Chitinophaga japonensis]|uniref:Putative iron-regulated membrane protein n=1 Tax=Chitinophaga japonensis TaxID=104662 RepID=A0A562T443_CHIJA|nr:PepSY-associated TM helix domain-containing protein [Chitinophaga japonensis]TWI88311.1 putative iron-regulated membrane protein [Chitinophaga japonensis]